MDIGHIHGRFQPFHNGHKRYLEWALNHCENLIVGITNADPNHIANEKVDPERHKKRNNPYMYFERQILIRSYLESEGLTDRVIITPFPINKANLWKYYAPKEATHFVMVLEDWHEEKVRRLKNNGRSVHTKRGKRDISATNIRQKMRDGRSWESDVPNSIAKTIKSLNLELPLSE
jgi:nicotinamide-nucleotide adenylyltransferase